MERQEGDRVGAIISREGGTVNLLGYGEYKGEEIPSEEAGGMGPIARKLEMENPKIELDNGDVVWGCECWWGDESEVQAMVEDADEVNDISVQEFRQQS